MNIVVVCEMYGWTYLEYLEQPDWFLTLILKKMDIDAQNQRNATEKAKRTTHKK